MGSRKNSRKKMVLPLRVTGSDSEGKPFLHLAHTLDVSASGARLGGLRSALAPGDLISVQYRLHKSSFRVVWAGKPGTGREDQVGIECLDSEKKIFGLEIPWEAVTDDYEPEEDPQHKYKKHRSYTRYPVNGGADVRTMEGRKGTWGRLADLSLGGCYVQTTTPLFLHTRTRVLLKVGRTEIEMWGAVRTCHPDVGMGIQFTEPVSAADGERLAFLIKQLEAGETTTSPAAAKLDPSHIGLRMQTASVELMSVEDMVNSFSPNAAVLRPLRETLSHVRTTSWAVQKWVELEQQQQDLHPVISQLNNDRLRTAAQLCRGLTKEIQLPEFTYDEAELDDLLRAVEELFSQLAGFNLMEVEPMPEAAAVAEVVAPQTESAANGDTVLVAAAAHGGGQAFSRVAAKTRSGPIAEGSLTNGSGATHSANNGSSAAAPVAGDETKTSSPRKKRGEKKRRGTPKKSARRN